MMLTREEHERQIVRNLAAVGASVAVIMRLVPDRYTVEEVRSMVRSKALLLLGAEL